MDTEEVVEATYYWTANESLRVNEWIARLYYKKLGRGLLTWAVGLLLFALVFITLMVIFVYLLKSPNTLLTSGFWADLLTGWGESAANFGKLVGLFILVFGGYWINTRYLSPWFQRRRIRQYFSKNPDAQISIHTIINSEALTWEFGEETKVTNKWQVYKRVDKLPDGFLFHWGGQHTWLPNHAFKSKWDIEVLSRLAQQHAPCYEEVAQQST